MVSLIDRANYTSKLRKNQKVDLLFGLLFNSESPNNSGAKSPADKTFANIIKSIKSNNSKLFKDQYNDYNQRKPEMYAAYVNDDFLLFVLILGAKKFECDLKWIKEILEVRSASDDESLITINTFKNFSQANFNSKDNDLGIIMSFESLLGLKITTWEKRKSFYRSLVKKKFPFYSSDFLNLTSIYAIDLILLEGDKSRESKYNSLSLFEARFINRVKFISNTIHWLLSILIIGGLGYFYATNDYINTLLKENAVVFNLFGISAIIGIIITQFVFKQKLSKVIRRYIFLFWGYDESNNRK